MLTRLVRHALDIVFPPVCLACRKAIDADGGLCAACWGQIGFIEKPYCDRLGTPFAQDLGAEGLISPEAMSDPPVYARARAVARFDDGPTRQIVHRLKYGDRMEMAKPMGAWMARAGADLLQQADVIVPVPLHRARLWTRRFNQSAALARVISDQCGVPTDLQALARIKPTSSQVGLTRSQRAQNVQGAFRVRDEARLELDGRCVVLVDDVLTSGATINAASRALLRGGAKRVDVLVFARVVTAA